MASTEGFGHFRTRQRSVERLLQDAAAASGSAENRALKRRVRQRLHKRLGAMLPPQEFEEATRRFRDLESATATGRGQTVVLAGNEGWAGQP
ncbi:unnamed protein product [Effrenium voratum]|nr:unnamed protein product [Effrenium voratum]